MVRELPLRGDESPDAFGIDFFQARGDIPGTGGELEFYIRSSETNWFGGKSVEPVCLHRGCYSCGADVTHVDSVKPVVSWARENMEASKLDGVRWIVDDALKFVQREVRRGKKYNGIILDPPAYGRGANGEKWVLEENINELITLCGQLLEGSNSFLVLNLYSMGLSALLARSIVRQLVGDCTGEQFGELYFTDSYGKSLPLGVYYRLWRK